MKKQNEAKPNNGTLEDEQCLLTSANYEHHSYKYYNKK